MDLDQRNSRQVDNASYARVMPQMLSHGNPCKEPFTSWGETRPRLQDLPWYSVHQVFPCKEWLQISFFPCLSEKLTRSNFLAIFFFPSTLFFFNVKRELSFKQKCRRKAIWFPLQSVAPNNPVHYFTSDCLKMRPSHFSALIKGSVPRFPSVLHSSHCGRGRWSHTLPCTSPGPSFQILSQRKRLNTRTKIIVFSSGSKSRVSKS